MTILLRFNDYGTLNIFDDHVISNIKSFLSPTPIEDFIEIHDEMRHRKFRPYNPSPSRKIKHRRHTNFSMGPIETSMTPQYIHQNLSELYQNEKNKFHIRDDHILFFIKYNHGLKTR